MWLSTATQRLHALAHLIENPQLLALRRRGGVPATFRMLNRPWLKSLNIQTVLDIGANVGQFATTINAILPQARIYAFEPLPECHAQLRARMRDVPNFSAINLGLGDQSGEITFERNAFTPSSSFLKMNSVHKTAFPYTSDTHSVRVSVECLDTIAATLEITDPLMIKIDVQGYEDRVIRGGEQTIRRALLIIVETSFETLYEGQPLFDDIYRQMVGWGFVYSGSLDQLHHPRRGNVIQADSIFIRASYQPSQP